MLREDNNGFVFFPYGGKMLNKKDSGKTLVYLVAFDTDDISNKPYELSNLRLIRPAELMSDDITLRTRLRSTASVDELIKTNLKEEELEDLYFPNSKENNEAQSLMSIPFTTCICIGWSESTYEIKEDLGFWSASFRDLTNEGRKLYYSIKKLHNNKEVRILTFNTI